MFFKIFNWFVKKLPYSLAVMIFSFIFSALMAAFFVWFFLITGNFEKTGTGEIIVYIALGMTSLTFLLCIIEYGFGISFELKGKRKGFKILNENIINGHISPDISNQALLDAYDALNKINRLILSRHIQYTYGVAISIALAEWLISGQTTNVPFILISGLIWVTIAYISGIAYELFTLPARRECKIILGSRGINFKDSYFLSLNIKSNFFIALIIISLEAILFIIQPRLLSPVIILSFVFILIPISLLIKLIFETIYKAFLEIKESAEDLAKGKTAFFFTGSLDREIVSLSQSLNETAQEITNYQQALEDEKASLKIRVKARTKELEELNMGLEGRVEERTIELQRARDELQERVKELEKWRRLTVGRELKMVELKKKIKDLKNK